MNAKDLLLEMERREELSKDYENVKKTHTPVSRNYTGGMPMGVSFIPDDEIRW